MNEDRLRAELDRANRAKQIVEDPLFLDAIEGVKQHLWQEFCQSRLDDDDTRRNARIGIDMLDKILRSLKTHMKTGDMALIALAEKE